MRRRDFIKNILLFSLSLLLVKTKVMATSLFKPFNLVDGIFVNNYVKHKSSFKDFWKWRRESNKPEPISFPVIENNPEYLNLMIRKRPWIGHSTFLLQIDGVNILTDPFHERAF